MGARLIPSGRIVLRLDRPFDELITMRKTTTTLLFLSGLTFAPAVSAHIALTTPPARHPDSEQKFGPCGVQSGDARTTDPAKITTYMAGETITVEWTEIIDHDPAHYRIAFSREGDAFVDPTGFDDIETVYPDLLDGIPDADAGSGHQYSVEVTLPNEPCELCSLQLIQVMHDKPPWGPEGGDDIYYQCADIILLEDPDNPVPVDPDPTDPLPSGDGGAPSGEGTGGSGLPEGTGGASGTGGESGVIGSGGAAETDGIGGTTSTVPPTGGVTQSGSPEDGDSSTDDADEAQAGCSFLANGPRPWFSWLLLAAGFGLGLRRRRS